MSGTKKIFLVIMAGLIGWLAPGCDDDLTGEELLNQAVNNFEQAESYRAEAEMDTYSMGMSSSAEMEMIFEAPDNFYSDITIQQMNQVIEYEMSILDGEVNVATDDPETEMMMEMMPEDMFEQANMQQYEKFFLEKSEVEKANNPEGYDEGYKTFYIIPDSDVILDFAREEIKQMEWQLDSMEETLPEDDQAKVPSEEEIKEMMDKMLQNMEVDVESYVVIDSYEEAIVRHDMEMNQVMDISVLLDEDELKELEQAAVPEQVETVIEMEMRYKDYNEPVEFPGEV